MGPQALVKEGSLYEDTGLCPLPLQGLGNDEELGNTGFSEEGMSRKGAHSEPGGPCLLSARPQPRLLRCLLTSVVRRCEACHRIH